MLRVSKREELDQAINDASTRGATALNVLASPMLFQNRRTVIEQAAQLRMPAVYQCPETAEEGGLLGYGSGVPDISAAFFEGNPSSEKRTSYFRVPCHIFASHVAYAVGKSGK